MKYKIYIEGLNMSKTLHADTLAVARLLYYSVGKDYAKQNVSYGDAFCSISTETECIKCGYIHYNRENGKYSYRNF